MDLVAYEAVLRVRKKASDTFTCRAAVVKYAVGCIAMLENVAMPISADCNTSLRNMA